MANLTRYLTQLPPDFTLGPAQTIYQRLSWCVMIRPADAKFYGCECLPDGSCRVWRRFGLLRLAKEWGEGDGQRSG